MADVQSPFNPEYERKHEETYLNYSRGADAAPAAKPTAPTNESNLVSNAGNIFLAAVDAKDAYFKDRIYEEAVADVDAVRDPWIGVGPGGTNLDVPVDIKIQTERMAAMTDAMKQRKTNPDHYWMLMNDISRSLRSKYPGYREHIDGVISNITGGTPANVLQRSIEQAANKSSPESAAEKERQDLLSYATKSLYLTPEMEEMPLVELRREINKQTLVTTNLKRQQDELEVEGKLTAVNSEKQAAVLQQDVDLDTARLFGPAIKELDQNRARLFSSGQVPTTEQIKEIGLQATAIKAQRLAELEKKFLDPKYKNVTPEAKQRLRQSTIDSSDMLTNGLQSGSWNSVDFVSNAYKMESDGAALNVLKSSDLIAKGHAIQRNLGNVAFDQWLSRTHPGTKKSNLDVLDQALADNLKIDSLRGNPGTTPLVSTLDKVNNSVAGDKKNIRSDILNTHIRGLSSKDFPMNERARIATNIFGPDNKDFITRVSTKDSSVPNQDTGTTQVQIFKAMNSPEVAKSMIELRDAGYTEQYNDYQEWRKYTFYTLFKGETDTMKNIVTDRQSMNLQFDVKTGKVVPQDRGPQGAWEATMTWAADARGSINRFNMAVDGLTPAWLAEGKDPGLETAKLLSQAGVDFNTPKSDSLWSSFTKAMRPTPPAPDGTVRDPIYGGQLTASESAARNKFFSTILKPITDLGGIGQGDRTGDPLRVGPDLQGIMEFSRTQGYTPGSRESSNIEDRRNLPSGMMRAGENFQVPNQNSTDGLDPNSIEESLRGIFGDRAPMMLGYSDADRQSSNIEDRRASDPSTQRRVLMQTLDQLLGSEEPDAEDKIGEILEQLKALKGKK